MTKLRWLLAVPLLAAFGAGSARAATIRDEAGLFSPEVVRQAEARLERIEEGTHPRMSITIETIDSLQGDTIKTALTRHAQRSGTHGIYILIAKKEAKLDVRSSSAYRDAIPESRERKIYDAFLSGFKRHDFDAGLKAGVQALQEEVNAAKAENGGVLTRGVPVNGGIRRVPMRGRPAFGIGSLLGIGLAVLAVLFVLRLIGSAMGGGAGAYGGGPARMMGGPGVGGPGYGGGGGGGGFFSSMLGGIGGAMAGNWLYDQFSGRHHGGYADNSSYADGSSDPANTGADDWSSGADVSGSWNDGGDGGGGGGDWGGGGDGGGGGGDWGGGGGGGDW